MAKNTPKVVCNQSNASARLASNTQVVVGTPAWFNWLEVPQNRAFIFEPQSSIVEMWSFSAQKEERKDGLYWYAYKRFKGKLERQYLGQGSELILDKLLVTSKEFHNKFCNSSTTVPRHSAKDEKVKANSSTTVPQQNENVDDSDSKENQGLPDDEAIKLQSTMVQSVQADVERLEREKVELENQRSYYQDCFNELTQQKVEWYGCLKEKGELEREVEQLKEENAKMRSQLDDMAVKAGEWYDKAKEAQRLAEDRLEEIERLPHQTQPRSATDLEVTTLLQNAIVPKTKGGSYDARNATGLKKTVERVLQLLKPIS